MVTGTGRFAENVMTGKFSGTHFEGSYRSPIYPIDRRIVFDKKN